MSSARTPPPPVFRTYEAPAGFRFLHLVHAPTEVLGSLLAALALAARNTVGSGPVRSRPRVPGNTLTSFPVIGEKGRAPAGKGLTSVTNVLPVARAPHAPQAELHNITLVVDPSPQTAGPPLFTTVLAGNSLFRMTRVPSRCYRSSRLLRTGGAARYLAPTARTALPPPDSPVSSGTITDGHLLRAWTFHSPLNLPTPGFPGCRTSTSPRTSRSPMEPFTSRGSLLYPGMRST